VVDALAAAGAPPGALRDVHLISLRPGAIRGNHYHPDATEWMLIWGGRARLLWRDAEPAEGAASTREETVEDGEPVLFEIPPGVAHAILNIDDRVLYGLCVSDVVRPEARRLVLAASAK